MITSTGKHCQIESIRSCWDEGQDLIRINNSETGDTQFHFSPNKDYYFALDDQANGRFFTVRHEGQLVGYSFFIIHPHIIYTKLVFAYQDLLFIHADHRGKTAWEFMNWCDDELAKADVNIIGRVVSKYYDFSETLKAMGYEHSNTVYERLIKS